MAAGQRRPIGGGLAGLLGLYWFLCGGVGPSARARADLIELRGGGQVQGKVIPDPKNKDRVQVLLMRGRHPLSFRKDQIARVVSKASPLDEYVNRLRKVSQTAEAQFALGEWCERNKLPDLARQHYERAVDLDADHEGAHKKLGHVRAQGAWLTRDELSAAQGLVKYKGRWVTEEQKTKRQAADRLSAAQGSWLRRIRMLRTAIVNGSSDRRREAESQLMSIRDPDAVVPLVRVFGQDDATRRILLALVLSTIGGHEATAALVQRVLDEPDSEVRTITFEHLKQRDDAGVTNRFIRALGREDIKVINRAAWALGNLNAVESVPHLVAVLVTYEDRIVVPQLFGGPPQPTVPTGPGIVPRGFINNGYGMVYSTPPVVSNGAAAMGVGVIPYVPAGMLGGNYAGAARPQEDAHLERFTYRNVEVLTALQKLTGQDFGYNMDSWKSWITRSFNPHPRPSRRVPQP